jgi:hypothetical protein
LNIYNKIKIIYIIKLILILKKIQLRTNRKKKSTDLDDLGYEEKPTKTHKKSSKPKISPAKDYSMDEVRNNYII